MKTTISIILFVLFSACAIQPLTQSNQNTNANACQKPKYVATVAKKTGTVPEASLLYTLITDAQSNFGPDVTIQNIRYDKVKGVKVSAIYDVVRCDTSFSTPKKQENQ